MSKIQICEVDSRFAKLVVLYTHEIDEIVCVLYETMKNILF